MIIMPVSTWSGFKSLVTYKGMSIQYSENALSYEIYAAEAGIFVWNISLLKNNGADVNDFEDNYKTGANKPLVSKFSQSLGEDRYSISPRCLEFTATKQTSTTHDKLLDEALAIRGGILEVNNRTFGDWIECQVIDKDNVLGFGANTIISTYVPEWKVLSGQNDLIDVSVGQLPAAGLYFRVVYHSSSSATVDAAAILNIISYQVG